MTNACHLPKNEPDITVFEAGSLCGGVLHNTCTYTLITRYLIVLETILLEFT